MEKEKNSFAPAREFDYKDVETLRRFLSPHGKIMPRRRTGLSATGQRNLAEAIKRARFMALLPFVVK
ncbi:MAG: 30S ribosomal protein S18 [Minisyncoccia bacterium]